MINEENSPARELYTHHLITVDPGQEPLRIDKFLTNKIQNLTRNKIQLLISNNFVFSNQKAIKANYKVKPQDVIKVVLPIQPREDEVIPENIPIDIHYEDDDLLIVNKPAGMVVHPAYNNWNGTLVNALAYHFDNLPNKEGNIGRPGLVHRIDKDTSGLLVIAKTEESMIKLAKQFFDHTLDRKYLALVWGDIEQDQGTIDVNLVKSPKDRRVVIGIDDDSGKKAITHFKVIERFGYVTLIECSLKTGRTHQIRAHFKYIGHPLFGDKTYGGDKVVKGPSFSKYRFFINNCFKILPRQALHAQTIGFVHPTTNEKVFYETNLPEDIKEVIDKWRRYTSN